MKIKETTWQDQICFHCGKALLIEESDLYVVVERKKQFLCYKCISCLKTCCPNVIPNEIANKVIDRFQTIEVGDSVEITSGEFVGHCGQVIELEKDGMAVVSIETDIVSHVKRLKKIS